MRTLLALSIAFASFGSWDSVNAQQYPTKTLRIVVPFTPGGGTDILARLVAQKLTESMGQQVLVENRPGAGGTLGAELVVRAPADGYTLLMVSASYAVNPSLYKLKFDAVNDLAPVSLVAAVPFVLVTHPAFAAKSVKELVALARAKPGEINYASSGNGSAPHLAGAYFTMMTHTKMNHIPYKGGTPAMMDVVGGQVELLFSTVVQALPQIKADKLKAIAVSSAKRSSALPAVPTIAESGVSGYDIIDWFGVLAPARTSPGIVTFLNKNVVQAIQNADVRTRLANDGVEPVGSSAAELARIMRDDIEKFGRIVQAAGVRLE